MKFIHQLKTCWTKKLLSLVTLIILLVDINSCKKEDVEPSPPIIESFSPATGVVGEQVTIAGKNFGQDIDGISVSFGSVAASVDALTATLITTTVPVGASTGKISVSVNGLATISETEFTVEQPVASLAISGFSPLAGKAGTSVVINGDNFSTQASSNVVKFNGTTAVVSLAGKTQLTVTVPEGATTGKISVSVDGGTVSSAADFVVFLPPTITSFSPASGNGPHPGVDATTVTISGTNFNSVAANNVVKFNDVTASVLTATPSQLTAAVPAGATTGKLTIEVNGFTIMSSADFIVNQPPAVNSFTPLYGLEGTSVTIAGTGFSDVIGENLVLFNGTAATITSASSTQLIAEVPGGSSTGAIEVRRNGLSDESSGDFEVIVDYPRSGLVKFYPFDNSLSESLNGVFNFSCDAIFVQDRFARTQQAITFSTTVCGIPGTVVQDAPWTISMWIKYSGITGNKGLLSSMQSGFGIELYLAETGGGYVVEGFGRNGVSSPYVYIALESTPYLTNSSNGWMNVTMTYNGTAVNTYINGALKDTENVTAGSYGISTQFTLGYSIGEKFVGEMDDLLIYNRVLSASELVQLYQQTATKYPGL